MGFLLLHEHHLWIVNVFLCIYSVFMEARDVQGTGASTIALFPVKAATDIKSIIKLRLDVRFGMDDEKTEDTYY